MCNDMETYKMEKTGIIEKSGLGIQSEVDNPYRVMAEKANDGIIIVRGEKILYVNEKFLDMMGFNTFGDVENISPFSFVHPDDQETIKGYAQNRQSGATVQARYEIRYIRTDGSIIWVELSASFIHYYGEPASLAYLRDVTERKRLQQSVGESENRFRSLAEATFEGILIHDKGEILDVNPVLLRMTGYHYNDVIGKNVIAYVDPSSIDLIMKYLPLDYDRSLEVNIIRKDGNVVPVELSGKPVLFNGRDARVVALRDISGRKAADAALRESERKYRMVVENAGEGIYIAQEGMIKFPNPRALAIYNRSESDLTSRPFVEFIHPDDRELVLDRHLRRTRGEDVPSTYPFRILTQDGETRWVEVHAFVIQWEGKPAVWNFISDVTDRIRLEEERAHLINDLQKALAEVKTLSGLLPICASCKKIRKEEGTWQQIELYIKERSDAEFSHGICPECMEKLYPGLGKKK